MLSFAARLDGALTRLAGRRRPLAAVLLVAVLALVAFLPAITTLPPVDRDEARFAQATKQMLTSGDYIDIRFQDRARNKKPVGIYWLQAAAVAALDGGAEDRTIWHYRLPSITAAVAAVALTARLAAVFGGAGAALTAGLPMAGMFLLGAEAHLAKTDAVLLALILLAQLVLAQIYRAARDAQAGGAGFVPPPIGNARLVLFWGALAAGVLVKGPIAPLVVGLTALVLSLAHWRRRWLGALRPKPGLVLFAVLVVPWFAAITWRSGGAFWSAALGHDLLGKVTSAQESHGAPPGTYLALLWLTFQPAAIALALSLPAIWRARAHPGIAFAAAWALPAWALFEAMPTKLPHYVLPLYPALALALGLVWAGVAAAPFGRWRRGMLAVLGALPVLGIVAAGAYGVQAGAWGVLPRAAVALALAGLGLWLAWVALAARLGFAALAGLWLLGAGLLAGVFPVAAHIPALWPAKAIVALIPQDPACQQVSLYEAGYDEPSLVFLAPGPVIKATPAEAARRLLADRCAAAVAPRAEAAALGGARHMGDVRGLNLGTGRTVDLSVFAPVAKP